ncbi:hypothetical protein [Seonamhaeicola sp. ML3]|uniref:hypothetical protein n=1 Tax=Seonamhaeicola sp. ML3 TaxID=2937786 RepID=UPI00200F1552|nr:hypothetical protein [Seonamhaeicola sp. ML3]
MKFKIVHVVHATIFVLAGYIYYSGIAYFIDFLRLGGYGEYDYYGIIGSLERSRSLHACILITFPLIGVFLKNKIGWLFVTSYLYLISWYSLFQFSMDEFSDFQGLVFLVTFVIVITLLLIIMNLKRVVFGYYKIDKNQSFGINILACVLGLCFSTLLYLAQNLHLLSY